MEQDIYPEVATHELLHCLGLKHEHNESSIMAEVPGLTLLADHVSYVRGLMGLGPSAPAGQPEEDDFASGDGNETPGETDDTIPNIRVTLVAVGGAR